MQKYLHGVRVRFGQVSCHNIVLMRRGDVIEQQQKMSKPLSLVELKACVLAISRGEGDISLGVKALDVLSRLVVEPDKVALSTISELASCYGVNASTLTRLAKSLGFKGFNEFQALFRQSIARSSEHFYSQQAGTLLRTASSQHLDNFDVLMVESVKNMQQLMSQLEAEDMALITRLLAHQRRVCVYAQRQFHSLACFLSYGLGLIRPQVQLISSEMVDGLVDLSDKDVVLVASCEPYTRGVVELAGVLQKKGVKVIAITDYLSSPLVEVADTSIFVSHKSSFIINSMSAHIFLAEGLINNVAIELGIEAIKSLQASEALYDQLNINL